MHVESRAGRVAVAWRQQEVDGITPLGNDWVPATADPATSLLVPGIPDGGGPRLLRVLAPGRTDAIVKLRLVTPDGPVTPTGLEVLEVRGGTVAEIDLAAGLAGKPGAIQLESDEPVTASVEARVGQRRRADRDRVHLGDSRRSAASPCSRTCTTAVRSAPPCC